MTPSHIRDAQAWAHWYWETFLPGWLIRVQDGQNGVFDSLDQTGSPDDLNGKSLLAQARMLFTLSHAGLSIGDARMIEAAGQIAAFLGAYRKGGGLYRNRVNRDGSVTGHPRNNVARSYDHSFVILGLVTWHRLSPNDDTPALIDACWHGLMTSLTDPATGLLRNDDTQAQSNPAQNPHMHLFEACLQAHQMTGDATWITRAADLRATGLAHFWDDTTGSIAEFITPDLTPLPGADGRRREIGHQCEWAWLLLEEARLKRFSFALREGSTKSRNAIGGQMDLAEPAGRLFDFADRYGFARHGPLAGAVVDAVSAVDGAVVEDSFLLWPQTEAIKILAVRHRAGDPRAGARAQRLLCTMFERWFADRPAYVNQLDSAGNTQWPQALTRLMYHIVLAMTEGQKAGLWQGPSVQIADETT